MTIHRVKKEVLESPAGDKCRGGRQHRERDEEATRPKHLTEVT